MHIINRPKYLRERQWLREKMYVITASLKEKLDKEPLDATERRRLCAVQSTVLEQMHCQKESKPSIGREMFQQECRSHYLDYVARLIGWKQLDGDRSYWHGEKGWCMKYWVPKAAIASGYLAERSMGERTPRRKPQITAPDDVSMYALSCTQRLRTPINLVLPADIIRECLIRDHMIGIALQDFQVRYGGDGRRLFHRVIEMPKEGRRNLQFCEPLMDFDVQTCVPVLFLPLFSDTDERKRYTKMLDGDIYTNILERTGISLDRYPFKKVFAQIVNEKHRNEGWLRQHPLFRFFETEFPKFTREHFAIRSDLARHFQMLESSIMIQKLGAWCRQVDAFWIPQHDGFLAPLEHGIEIEKKAVQIFEEMIGYTVRLKRTPVEKLGQ